MNHCMNASTVFSPAQLMFSHSSGVVADLSGGAQELVMVKGGGVLPRESTGGRTLPGEGS